MAAAAEGNVKLANVSGHHCQSGDRSEVIDVASRLLCDSTANEVSSYTKATTAYAAYMLKQYLAQRLLTSVYQRLRRYLRHTTVTAKHRSLCLLHIIVAHMDP